MITLKYLFKNNQEWADKIKENDPEFFSKLSKELRNILEAENIKDNYFILSNSLKPVEPRLLRKRFDNMLEKNRIKHYKFHSLRHTFATKCFW